MSAPTRQHARGSVRRALAGAATFLYVLVLAPGAGASTASQLAAAKSQLAALERQVGAQQAAIASSQAALVALAAKLDRARASFDRTQGQLMQVRSSLAATQQEYEAAQAALDQRAIDAYMFGPGSGLEIVLGATSPADLNDRLQFTTSLAIQDRSLADAAAAASIRLDAVRGEQQALLNTQAHTVTSLNADQLDLEATFATEQQQLAALSSSRAQVVQLVDRLAGELRAEELAAATVAVRGSSTASFDHWARLLLGQLGDQTCTNDVIAVVAWETAEYTQAAWNPLATTHDMPGATVFNWAGVKNYVSLAQGLQATVDTLRGGAGTHGYGAILGALAGCVDPMTTALAINASDWCHGCAGGRYVVDVVPSIQAYYAAHPSG